MIEIPTWHIAGDWFDNGSCAVACPCTFAQPPDNGFCESVLFWHIQRGHYGDVNLDGLSSLRVGRWEGDLWGGKVKGPRFSARDLGQVDGLLRRCVRLQVPVDDEFEQAHPVRLDGPMTCVAVPWAARSANLDSPGARLDDHDAVVHGPACLALLEPCYVHPGNRPAVGRDRRG
jgi:Protein of unknown function (DUF1326)